MLDPIIILILLAGLVYGVWRGLVRLLHDTIIVICFFFSFLVAFILYKPIATKMIALLLHQDIDEILVFDVIFALLFIAGYKLNKLIHERWLKEQIKNKGLERMLGGLTGTIAALITVWLMLILFISAKPLSDKRVNMFKSSGMGKSLIYGSGFVQNFMPGGVRKTFKNNYRKIIYDGVIIIDK